MKSVLFIVLSMCAINCICACMPVIVFVHVHSRPIVVFLLLVSHM